MSKGSWLRAHSWMQCGADDGCRIQAGEPYLLIAFENSTKYRCLKHAGRELPADWEKARPAPVKPVGFSSLGAMAKAFDFKKAQSGE